MMKRLLFVGFVWNKVTEVVIDIEIKSIATMENKVMNDICKDDYLIDDRGKNGVREFKGEWIRFGNGNYTEVLVQIA